MEFCHFFLFVTFVVLTVDQFVERGDKSFELQKQDSHVFRNSAHFLRFVRKIRVITAQTCRLRRLCSDDSDFPETGAIFSQPPLISFKRNKNVGNFLVKSTFKSTFKNN